MWENDVFGVIPKEDWLDVGYNVTRQNDPVDGIMGDIKTDNLTAKWQSIAAEYQIPMMAQFHAFDTEAQKAIRIPVDTHSVEKGLIKVKINQSERMRSLMRTGVQENQLYEYVLSDGVNLAEQVFTRSKVAKNELLATGHVTIKENNLDLTVDYGVPAENLNLTLDFSTAASSDVLSQLDDIFNRASAAGVIINGIYTSKSVLNKIRSDASVQKAINGNVGVGALVRGQAFRDFMSDEYGVSIIVTNDLTYGSGTTVGEDGRPIISSSRYYPKDKITFFATNPAGKIGCGLWGNPPEVDAARFYSVSTEPGISPYVYVTQWMDTDPSVLWTKASGLFMPVLYNPNDLLVASVVTDDTGA